MPVYVWMCQEGHQEDFYEHVAADKGSRTYICGCGHTMGPVAAFGSALTSWATEKNPQTLWNLGPKPVTVRSQGELKKVMKERGLEWVAPKRGEKGCWT